MRKTLLGATVILPALSAGATLAADLPPLKDPTAPYLAASPVWTGFYAGLSAGYDFGGSNSATVTTWPDFINPAFAPGVIAGGSILQGTASGVLTLNNSGFVGGGQAGYNYQFSNNLVVGVETDIQGATGRGSANAAKALPAPAEFGFAVASTMTATKSLDYLGTVRGRIGWLASSSLLAYATGGLAYGGLNSNVNIFTNVFPVLALLTPSISSLSDTRVGWTVGGGLEWTFLANWSAKLEYLHYDLGNVTTRAGGAVAMNVSPPGIALSSLSKAAMRYDGNILRVGVNYHFNLFAPTTVLAKY